MSPGQYVPPADANTRRETYGYTAAGALETVHIAIGTDTSDGALASQFGYDTLGRLSTAAPPTGTPGPFRGGASYATPVADFDQNYDAINSYAQGAAGGGYTVRAGDTLAGIAQGLWGDAALWYKLAEANGLTATAALTDGMRLTVPGGVNKSHNTAGTNRVYDPSDAYGDTSPTSPTTPKPQKGKNKCGVFGQIIVTAIAVAITALVPGPGGIIGSALYGAAVSAASQGIGVLIGAQQKISWKGVALAGLTAGITQGVNPGPIAGSAFLGDVVAGAAVNATVQGVALATGLQSKFDFAGVAAAGIGAGVGGAVGGKVGGLGRFGQRLAVGTASGIANAASRSAVNGSSFGDNLMRALPDVIGQTIGGFFADAVSGNLPRSVRSGRGATADTGTGQAAPGVGGADARTLSARGEQGGDIPGDIVVTANRYTADLLRNLNYYQFGRYTQQYGDVSYYQGAQWASRLTKPGGNSRASNINLDAFRRSIPDIYSAPSAPTPSITVEQIDQMRVSPFAAIGYGIARGMGADQQRTAAAINLGEASNGLLLAFGGMRGGQAYLGNQSQFRPAAETITARSLPNQLGQAGEAVSVQLTGLPKNALRIPSVSGAKDYRIPDHLEPLSQRYIAETKNVKYQTLTSQILDDVAHVNRSGYPGRVDVIIDNRTTISGPLLREHLNPGSPIKIRTTDLNGR